MGERVERKKIEFVHLHAHTNLGSMLDALQSVDDLFDLVNLKGQKALAITDHGTLAAHFDAFKAYKRTGVKFIPGCEAYFVHSYDIIEPEGNKGRKKTERRKHIVLLAQNKIGYKNILRINYEGFKHFVVSMGRVFPRISWKILEEYNEGIIITSACGNGILSNLILQNKYDEATECAKRLLGIFKDRFYLEIQPHGLEDGEFNQIALNNQLIKMSGELKIPLVVAVDAHYLTRADEKVHDVLLAINAKKPVDDPNRHRYGIDEFYVKDGDEVYDFLLKNHGAEVADEALSNTVAIASRCDPPDYMETKGNHLPIFNPSGEPDCEEFMKWKETSNIPADLELDKAYMRFRVIKGFIKKFSHLDDDGRKKRWNRVRDELKILEGNNFSSYMLVTADFIQWAKDNDILVGVGRGCTTKDTKILTKNGFFSIDEINIGDKVLTHLGKYKEVKETFKYPTNGEALSKISTTYSFSDLVFTKDHKVFAVKAKKTKRYEKSLENNWKLPFKGAKFYVENNPQWIPIKNLSEGDYIYMPFPKEREHKHIDFFNLGNFLGPNDIINGNNKISLEKWIHDDNVEERHTPLSLPCDNDFCYMIGRWIGDGWILDKNQSYSIGFAFNRDDTKGKDKIIKYFTNLGYKCGVCKHKDKNLDQVYIYSYILAKFFRNLFPKYEDSSHTKYLGVFKNLSDQKLKSVLEGLFDSDGHFNYNFDHRESFDTVSENLLSDVREALLYLKIPSSVSKRGKQQGEEYICRESYKLRFTGFRSEKSSRLNIFENGYYVKILNITDVFDDFVYDISVEDDKSYVTQNYTAHNSVGGCIIAYLLGIHGVDPFDYGLLFERFQNAYKKDLPDIDTDFTSEGRNKVQEYVRNKYGRDNCAQVSNINTYTPKNVIPDLVKSMRNIMPGLVPEGTYYVRVAEAMKAAIPDLDFEGKSVKTLERAMELSPKLREFAEGCPELMEYADKIVGIPKEYSTHAAGMVVSDVPIYEFAPLRIDKNGEVAVQYEKNRCEAEGLVKMDFLAISTLDIIDETFKNIRNLKIENAPKQMEDIPLDDPATYDMIQKGQTKCVFQLGKSGIMAALCKRIRPKNILDIAMINALGRPAAKGKPGEKGARDEYINRRTGKEKVTYLHSSLKEPLGETYGLAITEEQLMGVARTVAGWDLNKADGLRKFTKLKGKSPELALKVEVEFIEGMMKTHNVEYELAKDVWDKYVAGFGGYGFNLSHAVFYSINGYITAYLKCHYPAAFLAAYLKIKTSKGGINRDDEINGAKAECRRLGIRIVPPDINQSKAGYEILDEGTIVMGLGAIKGMGEKALDEIIKKQRFTSFINFLYEVDGRIINKSKIEALAKAGCFDSFEINRKDVHDEGKKIRDKMNAFLRKRTKDGYDVEMAIEDFPLKLSGNEWSQQEKLRYEQEVLGELVSGSIHDLFPRFFTNNGVTLISKLRMLPNRHRIIVEVIVKSFLREFKIKAGRYAGQKMAKYLVEDVMGSEVELTVWPSEYAASKQLMTIGRPIRATCEVSDFNGAKTLMLKELQKTYGN